jgi:hypothetical protein
MLKSALVLQKAETFEGPAIVAHLGPDQGRRTQRSPQIMRYSIPLVVLGLLGGCATATPSSLTADNPASPSASEGGGQPLRNPLAADDLTRKTRELLAQDGKSQDQPSSTPNPEQQQTDQMSGMKMP